jgi:hypothetical protein
MKSDLVSEELKNEINVIANEIIDQNSKCAVWEKDGKLPTRTSMTCLTSETIKIEVFNKENEDPKCEYPYPYYSDEPSYIATSGKCVRTSAYTYSKIYISSTTGKFEENPDASWEIPDINMKVSKTAGNETKEAIKDREPGANSCMIADFEMFTDKSCTQSIPIDDGTKSFFLYLGNTEIQSTDCIYSNKKTMKGVMARSYCEGDTLTINSYNGINEDPMCLRPLPENGVNYTTVVTRSGECSWMGNNMYGKFNI